MSHTLSNADRNRIHGITDETKAILRQAKDRILAAMPSILDDFYRTIARNPASRAYFRDEAHMAHARDMQTRHWALILDGNFAEAYVESVTRIGTIHNRIGLDPVWYISGYGFLLTGLLDVARPAGKGGLFRKPDEAAGLLLQQALTRAVMIDMDYAISVYIEAGRRDKAETMARMAELFENKVGALTARVLTSSDDMRTSATEMTAMTADVVRQSEVAVSASQQADGNVQGAAAATEEMAASAQEIGRQVQQSEHVSANALAVVQDTVKTVGQLSEMAQRIGNIVDLINTIAGQTNLLALNATIEAARAGDAGRGFAVVASEVKQLAAQTAKATAEIGAQVSAIQSATTASSNSISQIAAIIGQINGFIASVNGAVIQQNAATGEIAVSVRQASENSSDVTRTILGVTRSTQAAGTASTALLDEAGRLSTMASDLRGEVAEFLAALRAA